MVQNKPKHRENKQESACQLTRKFLEQRYYQGQYHLKNRTSQNTRTKNNKQNSNSNICLAKTVTWTLFSANMNELTTDQIRSNTYPIDNRQYIIELVAIKLRGMPW